MSLANTHTTATTFINNGKWDCRYWKGREREGKNDNEFSGLLTEFHCNVVAFLACISGSPSFRCQKCSHGKKAVWYTCSGTVWTFVIGLRFMTICNYFHLFGNYITSKTDGEVAGAMMLVWGVNRNPITSYTTIFHWKHISMVYWIRDLRRFWFHN